MIRNRKSIYVGLVIILLVSVTIGYALINSTLNINGKSNISKNSWDVHFDNVKVVDGCVEAVKIPTIESSTTLDFEVNLNLPGDFYEFTVDVVNNGTIDAMIDGFNKTPDLTANQLKYLNYIIEYENGEEVASKQLVKAGEFVRLKVRVEYKSDITASDLPQSTETLNLGFTVNHIQNDGTGSSVKDNGVYKLISASGDINEIGTIVTIGDQQFYTIGTEGDNVKLLSMYNLYVGGESVDDNWTAYGSEATGKQDSTMLGYVDGQSVSKGTTAFSNTNSTYEGSIVEGYVNNYKTIIEGEEYGIPVVEARLITYDELTDLETFACINDAYCSDKYSWIYSTSYWIGSSHTINVSRYVRSDGYFYYIWFYQSFNFGVRPVIVIPKNYITATTNKSIVNLIIDDVTYQAEEGMTWGEWIESEYNMIGAFSNSGYVRYPDASGYGYYDLTYTDDGDKAHYIKVPITDEIITADNYYTWTMSSDL